MTAKLTGVRERYMRWLRTEGLLLATPLAAIAVAQLTMGAQARPELPTGLHTMLLALAVGSVAFGRALKRRPSEAGGEHAPEEAMTLIRTTSRSLLVAAITPSVIGMVLVPMTGSAVDLYITLGLTLLGLIMLFPRYVQWESWYASLTAGGTA
ncbi:MAG: hypothetical protein ABFC80_05125 [Coriobacteriales bacterium]|nr:hypothetical protein [Actinomycetes bacterium]